MGEITKHYIVTDKDGDSTKYEFIIRACRCGMEGCCDDTINIYEDGEEHPYSITVNGIITPFIEQLLDGSVKLPKLRVNYE